MRIMWKPVLEGQLANDAAQAVRDVAVAVAATPEAVAPADRTLFWAYATSMVDEPFAHAAYDAALDDVIATLRTGVPTPSLYDGGLAGIGFTLSHVLDGGAEDVLQVIDEALIGVLAVDRWNDSLDLAQGVVGLGVYFLERLHNNPQASLPRDGLTHVVHHLEQAAHRSDRGTTWLTTLEVMPEPYRARYPEGFHDCGVAHGVPGMIGFLARAARVTNDPQAAALCVDATQWLARQRRSQDELAGNATGRFPSMVPPLSPGDYRRFSRLGTDPGIRPSREASRAAWCYGDPGIAAATWSACPDLARETALDCAVREASTTGVRDTGLCHGATGLAHLSNRFYQATGDAAHAEAARSWFARALDMKSELPAAGGFASWRGADADGNDTWVASLGLLEGAIGV
ncbi:MAG: lanthionine synthetase C family protein, partial [Deltaproteobacteria bacterium]|nr:lanthionine synthetase C family protein [Deltaproteobacteria bacterium]